MTAIIREFFRVYETVENAGDPRVADWPLMGSPFPMLSVVAAYIFFAQYLGPRIMQNRPPMEIKQAMIVYDIILVIANAAFFVIGLGTWIPDGYHLYKTPVDYSTSPKAVFAAKVTWLYVMSKILDLFDTVFIVLRKNWKQLTFLHIYHHAIVVVIMWGAANTIPGGSITIVGLVNSLVHTIMYSYYLLTIVFPEYKKSVWWKKHLTELQLVQFIFLAVVCSFLAWHTDNKIVEFLALVSVLQNVFFFYMFMDFYKKTYFTKRRETNKKS